MTTAMLAGAVSDNTKPYSESDVLALSKVLAGECYDFNELDKIRVCEVILNRVSKGYGANINEVVTAPNQFIGYYKQSRPISQNDIDVATSVLDKWHKNEQKPLSNYLYFTAGDNGNNVFREKY